MTGIVSRFSFDLGVQRAILLHALVFFVLGSGYWLRVRPRYIWPMALLFLVVVYVAAIIKEEGVGAFGKAFGRGSGRDSATIMYFVILIPLSMVLLACILVVRQGVQGVKPKPHARPSTTLVWSGAVLAASLIHAVTILVILPRCFPNLDPEGARHLERTQPLAPFDQS